MLLLLEDSVLETYGFSLLLVFDPFSRDEIFWPMVDYGRKPRRETLREKEEEKARKEKNKKVE